MGASIPEVDTGRRDDASLLGVSPSQVPTTYFVAFTKMIPALERASSVLFPGVSARLVSCLLS